MKRISSKQLKWWPKWASLAEREYPEVFVEGKILPCIDPACKTRGCYHEYDNTITPTKRAMRLPDGTLDPCISKRPNYYRFIIPWHHKAIRWLSSRTQLLLLWFSLAIHDPIYGQCCPAFECCWREIDKAGMTGFMGGLAKAAKEGKSIIHVIKGGN